MDRSSRVRSGTFGVTSSLPPRWSRKVRSLTLCTRAPGMASTASVIASAWRASEAFTVRSTTSRSGCDSTMSTATTAPAASPTAVVMRPMPSGSDPRWTRMVIEYDALGTLILHWLLLGRCCAGARAEGYYVLPDASGRGHGPRLAVPTPSACRLLVVLTLPMASIATNDWILISSALIVEWDFPNANRGALLRAFGLGNPGLICKAEGATVMGSPVTSTGTAASLLADRWASSARWRGTRRDYGAEDVVRLWRLLEEREAVTALGALSGGQAVQMVRAGLEAIYLSGWQVAADANLAGKVYPDQSLYPVTSAPALVTRLNNALRRADQVESVEGGASRDWLVPIVADAEAGFGGPLNAFELTLAMIEAGAAGVHFEDQLAAEKKCGHLGGKVLVPTGQFLRTLTAARLAADVAGVETVLIARTDALAATLITSDVDERDRPFLSGERTAEGYWRVRPGLEPAIARGLAAAPYADLLWFETSTPDLDEAARFAEAIQAEHPDKALAYNCSPSFNWRRHLDEPTIARFQKELGRLGYRFQFITLAGFHALNAGMFDLAKGFAERGMPAYVDLQQRELALEAEGYTATRHQREVGTGYFDAVAETISGGTGATLAMAGSTEAAQF